MALMPPRKIKDSIDAWIAQQGIDAPVEARYQAPWQPDGPAEPIDLAAISAIIWAVGFHTDFSWIEVPAFDEKAIRDISAVSRLRRASISLGCPGSGPGVGAFRRRRR